MSIQFGSQKQEHLSMHQQTLKFVPNHALQPMPSTVPDACCPLLIFPKPLSKTRYAVGNLSRKPPQKIAMSFGHILSSFFRPCLALALGHMPIACGRSREFSPTMRTEALGCCTGLLALVPEQVAKSGKLSSVAPMIETLRFSRVFKEPDRLIRIWRD